VLARKSLMEARLHPTQTRSLKLRHRQEPASPERSCRHALTSL